MAGVPATAQEPTFGKAGVYSLPRAQDDMHELAKARADLGQGRVAEAVERLHRLLLRHAHGVVPAESGRRFLGTRLAVIQALRDLPPGGRDAYEKLVQREAGALLRLDLANLRRPQLLALAEDYPAAEAGMRARMRLGDLALEAGAGLEAEAQFRAVADAAPAGHPVQAELAPRRAAAQLLAQAILQPTATTAANRSQAPLERELAVRLSPLLPKTDPGRCGWPAIGGGGDGTRTMPAPAGKPQRRWEWQLPPPGFEQGRHPMHATGGIFGLYLNDGQCLYALDPLSGQLVWRGEGPMVDDPTAEPEEYIDSLNQDMVLATAVGSELVVGALQVPNDVAGATTTIRFRASIEVLRRLPTRRLFAFHRSTGKRIWAHWDHKGGPITARYAGQDAAGPPLIAGDTLYVASHDQTGAISYYLAAYDLATGTLKWRRLICTSQQEVNMFGNAQHEFAASPLALAGGVIYATTNLGVCYAADADTGRIRWITPYEPTPMPATQLTGQMPRPIYFANNMPVVHDGVLVCTPLDSFYALAFDTQAGEPLWRLPSQAPAGGNEHHVYWLLGRLGDEFVFSGAGLVGVSPRPPVRRNLLAEARSIAPPEALGMQHRNAMSAPRGALGDDRIWFPTLAGLRVLDKDGNPDERLLDLEPTGGGNLLLQDGLLVAVRTGATDVHFDDQSLLQQAEKQVRDAPGDPVGYLHFAALLRQAALASPEGVLGDKAEALYREGLTAARKLGLPVSSPIVAKLGEGLFQVSLARGMSLARRSPEQALPFLARARDEAVLSEHWLHAQLELLRLIAKDRTRLLAELDRMAKVHGDLVHAFPDLGRVPVAAYALWRGIECTEGGPAKALRCQELVERFGEVRLSGESLRELALRRLQRIVAEHGASAYAPIEQRAKDRLAKAKAGGTPEPEQLRWILSTYPGSEAAREAMLAIVDASLAARNATAAVHSLAQALREGRSGRSYLHRLVVALDAVGNRALAARLARELLANHGDEPADLPESAGRTVRASLSALVVEEAPVRPLPAAPTDVLARLQPAAIPPGGLQVRRVETPPGFLAKGAPPLYVTLASERLAAYDLERGEHAFDAALFDVPFAVASEQTPLYLCGDLLLLVEQTRVRALEWKTGAELWTHEAADDRFLKPLCVRDGVLHLYSEARLADDGGQFLGVEPRTGALLFRVILTSDRPSTPPLVASGDLFVLSLRGDTGAAAVERFDGALGRSLGTVELSTEVGQKLGLPAGTQVRGAFERTARRAFADPSGIYLPAEGQGEDDPPRLLALDHDGTIRWLWTGGAGRALLMAAPAGEDIVVLETSADRGSRFLVLDRKDKRIKLERPLEGRAGVLNWREAVPVQPAPATLFLAEEIRGPRTRLTCLSLDGRTRQFQHELSTRAAQVVAEPLLGQGFVAFVVRQTGLRSSLTLLQLETREDLLGGSGSKLLTGLTAPFRLMPAGPYIALQSLQEITLLGRGSPTGSGK